MRIIDFKFEGVEFHDSPNFSERKNSEISLLVIHSISLPPREYDEKYIIDFFLNELDENKDPYFQSIKDLKVSSHLLINRKGKVFQFVAFDKASWHAGVSNFRGKENCNEFSIGIELVGTDSDNFTNEQYTALSKICLSLMKEYKDIKKENIVGHSDIAPARKTDPGKGFNWERFKSLLALS